MSSPAPSRRRHQAAAAGTASNNDYSTAAPQSKAFSNTTPLAEASVLVSEEDKSDKSKLRRRDSLASSLRHFHQQQRFYIPLSLLLMTVLVFAGISAYAKLHGTPGLYTALPPDYYLRVPEAYRRHVCVDKAQVGVVRAFKERNWQIKLLDRNAPDERHHYISCYEKGDASVIWTKLIPKHWNASQPWQRHNQLPFETQMSKKARTTELLHTYAKQQGRILPFIPESYVLPDDRDVLLKRLTLGPDAVLRGGTKGGDNEPWVIKLSAIDNGVGIAMLGPGSDELKYLTELLRKAQANRDSNVYMTVIRRKLVFTQKDDTRRESEVKKAQSRTEKSHDKIIVQRYICHEL